MLRLQPNHIHADAEPIASLSQYLSPFRYPGGKNWLIPKIRCWLSSQEKVPLEFVEPFVGGGSISLAVACENLASHVTMADLDDEISSVWLTILGHEAKLFADRIGDFDLTVDSAKKILSQNPRRRLDMAFRALLRNRINHGGIMAKGAGQLKNGDGKGIRSRWYSETLQRRIITINNLRDQITFVHCDGFELLKRYSKRTRYVFFLDPPYVASDKAAGKRLYNHNNVDPEELFRTAKQLKGDFLMTYEDTGEIKSLAEFFGFEVALTQMKNRLHVPMTELLIGRDLNWLYSSVTK